MSKSWLPPPAIFTEPVEVVSAQDGNELVQIAQQRIPDLVVTDNEMPGLSGPEAIARLRQNMPELKAILVTTAADGASFPGPVFDKNHLQVRDLREAIRQQLTR